MILKMAENGKTDPKNLVFDLKKQTTCGSCHVPPWILHIPATYLSDKIPR